MQRSMRGALLKKDKTVRTQTLSSLPLLPFSAKKAPKVDLVKGRHKRKLKTMDFSHVIAGEELDTKLLQKQGNPIPIKENDNVQLSTCTLRRKMSEHLNDHELQYLALHRRVCGRPYISIAAQV